MSNGLLIGLMYSLIALGFVLVYKATDAINFAQGEFVMIAGFVAAGCLMVWGAPLWLAVGLAIASLVAFGFVLERVMLRKLIGRPVIAVVMATIGLALILRGVGPFTVFSGTKPLPLPVRDEPIMVGPVVIPPAPPAVAPAGDASALVGRAPGGQPRGGESGGRGGGGGGGGGWGCWDHAARARAARGGWAPSGCASPVACLEGTGPSTPPPTPPL